MERRCPVTGQPGPLRRSKRSHHRRNLGLGLGPHYCIGAPLGKLMIRVAFAELLDRVTRLQRDKSVPLNRRDGLSRPFRELRITFEAR